MTSSARRTIDPAIQVLDSTDVADVWDRFEVFEALHHNMAICNPMNTDELDEIIEVIGLNDGDRVLDIACGYGELLIRASARATIVGTGIDLSPWMITAAHEAAHQRRPDADLTWVLGEARDFTIDPQPDVIVCIGAEWVWHDFAGTARALAQRVASGGVAVIGAARLHTQADQGQVQADRGRVETIADMEQLLIQNGFVIEHRVDPSDLGWDTYLGRTRVAAAAWAEQYPGPRAQQWIAEQADWHRAREHDRDIIGWSAWVARRTTT